MGITADIRSSLDVCSDCINCKLVVWSSDDDTDKVADERSDVGTYRGSSGKYHYAVHCGWLKQKMPVAAQLVKCEGKKQQ